MHQRCRLSVILFLFLILVAGATAFANVAITTNGAASAVIMTRPSPSGMVTMAAQEFQKHIQLMSGVTLTISTVGNEGNYPGKNFVYIGQNTVSDADGVTNTSLTKEWFKVKTVGTTKVHIVGKDAGTDDWTLLSDCQPGTLFGVSYALGDILGCRWIWPGDLGIYAPANTSISFPTTDVTTGPVMVERKYRLPRLGKCYQSGSNTYGFGIPILPTSATRKDELADEEYMWNRHQQLGSRQNTAFAHYYSDWWTNYGTSHPEYFAVPPSGYSQPYPNSTQTKQCVSLAAMQQQRITEWNSYGDNINCCPADSRGFCTCSNCMAWDSPSQTAATVWNGSTAQLGDRYARQYAAIANLASAISSTAMVYGYAYDVYQNCPNNFTGIPSNVAVAYIPDCPSACQQSSISTNQTNVIGWMNAGCEHMYLRPNWMLGAHAGPYFPLSRCGAHYLAMAAVGDFFGFDSDSSTSSYAAFGPWYYMLARLMQNPNLTVSQVKAEYCSAFGSASSYISQYIDYWDNYINGVVDGGDSSIVGWSSCVADYDNVYTTSVFDSAEAYLTSAYAALSPSETQAKARIDFLKVGIDHGRLTSAAIALVNPTEPITSHPDAEAAMRSLLAFRDSQAESWTIWREWMIDREQYVTNMQNYWSYILSSTPTGESTANAFIESSGVVSMEAEHYSTAYAGTGTYASYNWSLDTATSGASGSQDMQALPNNGVSAGTAITGPMLDFKVHMQTTGLYYILVRMPNLAGADNSIQVGQNGVLRMSNLDNTTGAWSWRRLVSGNPVTAAVSAPGVYHLNIWMREDGVIVDKMVMTTNASYAPVGTDTGPAESGKRSSTEYTLTVNSGSGDGQYGQYSIVPVHADAPQNGYQFSKWTVDTAYVANYLSADTTVTMPAQAVNITATYSAIVTLTVNSGTGSGTYVQGQVVNISANTPPTGYSFDHWTGDTATVANTNASSTTITMPASNAVVTALYKVNQYTLTVTSGTGSGTYNYQQVVNISANTPPQNYVFSHWSGDTSTVANTAASSTTITMPAMNPAIIVIYVPATTYSLTVNSGTGSGNYTQGTVVNIAANTPPTGYSFDHWTGDTANVASTSSSSTTITMPAATTVITALYKINQYTLTVTSGTGSGTYNYQQNVGIAANTPPGGYVFDHWTGDTSTVANTAASSTTITIPAMNAAVTALYVASGSGDTFQESSGMVVMETEHYSSKAAGSTLTNYNWTLNTTTSGDSGDSMQALPNSGANSTGTGGPVMNFKVNFSTTGVYALLIRFPPLGSNDNNASYGLDGTYGNYLTQASTTNWAWVKRTSSVTITSTGVHTLNIWMRKDGAIVDKLILTTNSSYSLTGTDTGPAESSRQ